MRRCRELCFHRWVAHRRHQAPLPGLTRTFKRGRTTAIYSVMQGGLYAIMHHVENKQDDAMLPN